jgi:chaperonin cofactor prefoldin
VQESQEKVDDCLRRREEIHNKLQALSKEVKELEPQHEKTKRVVNEKKKVHKNAVVGISIGLLLIYLNDKRVLGSSVGKPGRACSVYC